MSHSLTQRLRVAVFCLSALLCAVIWSWQATAQNSVSFAGQLTAQHDTWNRMTTINVLSGQQVFFEVAHVRIQTSGLYTIAVNATGFTPAINTYGGQFFPAQPQVNFWDNGVVGSSQQVFFAGGQQFDIVISTQLAGQVGSYSVSLSGPGPLTIDPPPALGILTNPFDTTIRPGQTATLLVSTQGRPPKTYQWFQGPAGDTSNPVAGANSASFTTPPLFVDTSYWVRVSDSADTVDSSPATVFVTNGPIGYSGVLTACDDRFNRLVPRTNSGDPVQLSNQVVSYKLFRFRVSTPGTYQFQLNTNGFNGVLFLYQGVFLPNNARVNFAGNSPVGATVNLTQTLLASSGVMHLVIAQNTPADLGTFSLTVSGPAFVTKLPAPVITTPLANANITRGQLASFNVGTSTANPSVQWFKGCSNRTLIPGETTLSYTTPPQTKDEIYTVRLENAGGYETSSATVTILPFAGDVNADAIVQNTSLSQVAPGLLRSATAADGRTLTAEKVSNPAHGTVSINPLGGFTYQPASNYSGPDSFTYHVFDGLRLSNTATVNLTVVPIFANNTPFTIPSSGPASTYPSTINVSGLNGTISRMRVKLDRLRHESQGDLDILLVGPQGQALVLMSDANGDPDNPFLFDRVLTFEDAATGTIFDGQALFDGTYRPVNYGGGDSFPSPAPATFSSPAPAGSATLASVFNGTDPNGAWKLFIFDDQGFGSGALPGWSLTIFTTGGTCPRFTITPASLPEAVINTPFPVTTLAASGGAGLYTFQITAGALPNGISLTAEGVLSGTPTQAGVFTFTVTAKDENNCTWQRVYALNVNCPVLTINPLTLPTGAINQPYSVTLTGNGGSGPYTFTKLTGTLPNGVTLNPNGTFGGTPTQPGTFTLTVQTQDANGCSGTQDFTLTVNCQTLSVTPPANNTGVVNAPFSAQFTQTGGIGTTTFSTANTLPTGFTLAPSGTLSGTTVQTGSFPLTVLATDSNGCTGTAHYMLTINTCPALSFTVTTVPVSCSGGQNGNLTINAVGGLGALQYSINGGQSFQASNVFNNLSAGSYQIVVKGNDLCPATTGTGTVTQPAALALAPGTVPAALAGVLYSQAFNVSGGTGNKALSLAGSLPNGISFNNGVLSGTATQTGTFSFTLTAIDQNGCQITQAYTLQSTCPTVSLAPKALPNGVLGTAYNQSLSATPTGTNYSFTLTTGLLPPGLTLANNGLLSGTPTAAGSYAFGIQATGFGTCSGTQNYNLLITGTCATLTINPATLPATTVGVAYHQTVTVAGDAGPFTFAVTQGALPPGLTLNTSTGALTGTATQAGSFVFRLTATAQSGCTGSRSYVLAVACGTLTFTPTSLPNGTRGVAYRQQLTVSPAANATISVLLGSLPPGFTLDSTGLLSGITSQSGTYPFTVKALAANAGGCQGTKAYSLVIGNGAAALALSGDYDGDGKSDPTVWSAHTGVWRMLRSSNQQIVNQSWGSAGDVTLLGDYDGDGKSDLAVFRPADVTFYVKRSSDGSSFIKQWGLATDVPVPGDYDGDGKTDIAVWRGATGTWYIVHSSDGQSEVQTWGAAYAPYSDVPVPGDYDGDGKTDVGVFRRASGMWYVRQSSNGDLLLKQWGLGTDVPVAQDYDGDGKVDLAVWRGATGTWYIQASATGVARTQAWGAGFAPYFDQAVPGDYDGDGQGDVAVWRVNDTTWYLSLSGVNKASVTRVIKLGEAGDKPLRAQLY